MNSESDQSDAMGRSDEGEEEIPMKQSADDNGVEHSDEAPASFLDDDFLSFPEEGQGGAANGKNGGGDGGRSTGAGRGQLSHPMVPGAAACFPVKPSIPWLDAAATTPTLPCPPQQPQPWGRHRGYNNDRVPYAARAPLLLRLHNEIVSFVDLMAPTAEELRIRDAMVKRVTALAHRTFGGEDRCQVLPFGSQVTGLCLPGSDIDFVIRLSGGDGDDDAEGGLDLGPSPLHRFADAVRLEFGVRADDSDPGDDSEHLSYMEVVEQTRVPLVKFTVAPNNTDVDVCFDQPNGPEAADLMHRFMESMPPLRPLTFVLKHFLASRDINKPFTGGIGSYLLQLMLVSYLQHRARADRARGLGAGGRHHDLGSLLLDFFELYGMDFNYVTTGVSVRHDGFYFPKGQEDRKETFWRPDRPSTLAMENPLDPTANVGAGAFRIQMIRRIFEHAFKMLLAHVSEPAEPTDSILATIVPPTKEMEERKRMKERLGEGNKYTASRAKSHDDKRHKKEGKRKRHRDEKKHSRHNRDDGRGSANGHKSKHKKHKDRRHSK